jgi:uncharacterized damage-inducible protein DinB
MIQSVESFIGYFESIRRRTLMYINVLPPDRLSWTPKPGEFTCGDLIYHIAETEGMYLSVIQKSTWKFAHHDHHGQPDFAHAIADLDKVHQEAMQTLRTLPDTILLEPRPTPTPNGPTIKAWRVMMMMVEHEVHHRSQLATYLTLMGIQPPQIYGVTLEEVIGYMTS